MRYGIRKPQKTKTGLGRALPKKALCEFMPHVKMNNILCRF